MQRRLNLKHTTFAALTLAALVAVLLPHTLMAQRLPAAVIPEHYWLSLTPDLNKATFSGKEKIEVAVQHPTKSITLNAAELAIPSAAAIVNGNSLRAIVTLDEANERATFTFPTTINPGGVTLEIEFSGTLNNDLRGFYLSKTSVRNYAVTQFEATDARRAFPCFDEPALKATYDVTLVVSKGDTAISNTNIVSDIPGPLAEEHTIHFAVTPKMSTYLVAFLVGDFKCISGESDGIPIRACATPGKEQLGKYALSSAKYFLHYYDKYFGIKYPMPKLDMIAIPDFEAGAMENFGAITYREAALLIDENTASLDQKKTVAVDVAHEMAHQWFGDMVTMQWWDNLWLNEGFATWMEYKAVAQWEPEWNMSQDAAADIQNTLDLDSRRSTRTIRAQADTPSQINQMFDGIAYGKAGAVLRMVENYEGEDTFRRGVHNYLAAHLYGNATAEDFWNAQTAESHKPVDEIMGSLVTQPGVPLLTFGDPLSGKTPVSQQRFFLSSRHAADAPLSWTLPVCIGSGSKSDGCAVVSRLHPEVPVDGAEMFFANAGGTGYYRSRYSAADYEKLVAAVESRLRPEERISLLGDESALMHADYVPVGAYLDLVSAMKDDSSNFVIERAVSGVNTVRQQIAFDAQEQAELSRWIDRTFSGPLSALGEPAGNDSPARRQLRAALLGAVGESGRDAQVIAGAKQIAAQYIAQPGSVDPTLAAAALNVAAANGDAHLLEQLQRLYEGSADPQVQSVALNALGRFPDPHLIERTVEYVASGKVRNQDAGRLLGRMLTNPETRDNTWHDIEADWNKVVLQLPKGGGGRLVGGTGSFCTVEARNEVTGFFAGHPVPGSDRALTRAMDQIDDCIALRAAQGPALKEWLQRHQQ